MDARSLHKGQGRQRGLCRRTGRSFSRGIQPWQQLEPRQRAAVPAGQHLRVTLLFMPRHAPGQRAQQAQQRTCLM